MTVITNKPLLMIIFFKYLDNLVSSLTLSSSSFSLHTCVMIVNNIRNQPEVGEPEKRPTVQFDKYDDVNKMWLCQACYM